MSPWLAQDLLSAAWGLTLHFRAKKSWHRGTVWVLPLLRISHGFRAATTSWLLHRCISLSVRPEAARAACPMTLLFLVLLTRQVQPPLVALPLTLLPHTAGRQWDHQQAPGAPGKGEAYREQAGSHSAGCVPPQSSPALQPEVQKVHWDKNLRSSLSRCFKLVD